MSYLFRGNKRYFNFLAALEEEGKEYRKMGREYMMKSQQCNSDYKKKAARMTHTLRQVGAREFKHNTEQDQSGNFFTTPSKTMRPATKQKITINKRDFSNTSKQKLPKVSFLTANPSRAVSSQWPVRPSSAIRILQPPKLEKYQNMADENLYRKEKDPPIIHGTGIQNNTFDNRNTIHTS